MRADVDILTTDLPRVIVVPGEAVVRDSGATYVLIVRNGVPQRQAVAVSAVNETSAAILSGLRAGDIVVTRPAAQQ